MADDLQAQLEQLKFRDPIRARALSDAIAREVAAIGRAPVSVMHVCGSHEQSIARFGLRACLPRELDVIMGPGCPVCVTDLPEVDEAVALSLAGHRVATYGDMLRVPGTSRSLADAQAEGGIVDIVYSLPQAVDLAKAHPDQQMIFFASGFETTAVTTAAVVLGGVPDNFSILSVHKYVPPAMEAVAQLPGTHIEGFLAAGHAAAITGYGLFEPFAAKYNAPVAIAGFEPLDVLAAILKVVELIRARRYEVANVYPRVVSRDGNKPAQAALWKVFEKVTGRWRGIADIPDGNLRLRPEYSHLDARKRFRIDLDRLADRAPSKLTKLCVCGEIMSGIKRPSDCPLFGKACVPDSPVGACMVSSEGSCRIWHTYGGAPDLREVK